jgi:hypothetical protein
MIRTEQEIRDVKEFFDAQYNKHARDIIYPTTVARIEGIMECLDWVLNNIDELMGDDNE